jgi:competence protein ComEA
MFKKLLFGLAVDVNKADQAALDGIKGLGPKTSKAILDERKKGGEFKDWADFESRVKGIGEKSAMRLSQAGLTVNGQPKQSSSAAGSKEAKKDTKASAKEVKQDVKAEAKATKGDAKDVKKDVKADAKDAKKDPKKEETKK